MFTDHDETALRTGQGECVGPMTYPSITDITPRPEPVTPEPFIDRARAAARPSSAAAASLELRSRASGCRVVSVSAVQSEMELEFAALHQLCVPLLDRLGRLPGPHRTALGIAVSLTESILPDRFFLRLAVVTLLSEAAEERPLVRMVDDAQWLDPASSQILSLCPRRSTLAA